MSRTPEEILAEIAGWPLEERLRLAARILDAGAAELHRAGVAPASVSDRRAAAAGPEAQATVPPVAPRQSPAPAPADHRAGPKTSAPTNKAQPALAPEPRRLLVVDGSNFLGTVSGFHLASDASRDELILRLQEYAHDHPSFRIVAYFDGQKSSVRRSGGVEIRFTSGQRPADFFILEALKAVPTAERHHSLLITADRALEESARRLNVKVEAPASFHRRLPGTRRPPVGERGLSASEVADWESYFQQPPPDQNRRGK